MPFWAIVYCLLIILSGIGESGDYGGLGLVDYEERLRADDARHDRRQN